MSSASQRQDILRQQSNSKELWLYIIAAVVAMIGGLALVFGGTSNTLILTAAIATGLLILRDFRIGVIFLIMLMPLAESTFFPRQMFGITGMNPVNLLMLATLGSYAIKHMFGNSGYTFMPRQLFWLYLIPIILAGIHGAMSANEIPSYLQPLGVTTFDGPVGYLRDIMMKPLLLVILALLVGAAVYESERPELFFIPALIMLCVYSLMIIGAYAFAGQSLNTLAEGSSRGFLSKLGMHANDLGFLLSIAYTLILFIQAYLRASLLKAIMIMSLVVIATALILTFSRGAYLGFAVANVIFLLSRKRFKVVIYGLLIAALLMLAMPDAVYERLGMGVSSGNVDKISAGRVDGIWIPLLPELLKNPVVGQGLSSILWSDAMKQGVMLPVGHPHNAYLDVLLDMGVVGLALFTAFFWYIWKGFRNSMAQEANGDFMRGLFEGASIVLIVLLAQGISGQRFTPIPPEILLWTSIGYLFGYQAKWLNSRLQNANESGMHDTGMDARVVRVS